MGDRTAHRTAVAADHPGQVRTLFDAKAAGWPAKYAADGRLAERLDLLAAVVRDRTAAGAAVLDLGCGSGELARHLAAGGYRVTGCDIAPAMVRRATEADRERSAEWILLGPGWTVLPLATGSVDTVVASSVLEYVREPGAVLAECARVLRPGGGLLCTVPNLAHPVRWLEWPLRLAAATPLGPPPLAATGRTTPGRSQQYLAYLRTSCQRKRVRWWHAAGREAGFEPAAAPRPRRSLHLLIFTLPGGGTGQPAIPGEL